MGRHAQLRPPPQDMPPRRMGTDRPSAAGSFNTPRNPFTPPTSAVTPPLVAQPPALHTPVPHAFSPCRRSSSACLAQQPTLLVYVVAPLACHVPVALLANDELLAPVRRSSPDQSASSLVPIRPPPRRSLRLTAITPSSLLRPRSPPRPSTFSSLSPPPALNRLRPPPVADLQSAASSRSATHLAVITSSSLLRPRSPRRRSTFS